MPRFEVRELRRVVYTVEVPEGVTGQQLAAAKLDSANYEARGMGGIIADQAELVSFTVEPALPDDDSPADVVLDAILRDKHAEPAAIILPRPHTPRSAAPTRRQPLA